MIVSRYVSIFCSNETATPEIYTLPYTTLFRSRGGVRIRAADEQSRLRDALLGRHDVQDSLPRIVDAEERDAIDRKSTRLNSSHSQISYAVFCLKKKNKKCPTLR